MLVQSPKGAEKARQGNVEFTSSIFVNTMSKSVLGHIGKFIIDVAMINMCHAYQIRLNYIRLDLSSQVHRKTRPLSVCLERLEKKIGIKENSFQIQKIQWKCISTSSVTLEAIFFIQVRHSLHHGLQLQSQLDQTKWRMGLLQLGNLSQPFAAKRLALEGFFKSYKHILYWFLFNI